MDVERVESAARSLQARASDIDGLINRIDAVVSRLPGVWEGPEARRFVREWWPAQRRVLAAASSHVLGLSDAALKNVADQRDVSASGGPASHGGGTAAIGGLAVQSAADRYTLTRDAGEDGVRIQGVRGADGQLRYIAYIDGTNSSWVGDHGILENVAEFGAKTQTYWNIVQKMISQIQPPGSEVMVVGYSQGGILAQHLADSKLFKITDVMTFGSPYYDDGDSVRSYNIVRIGDDEDVIPRLGGPSDLIDHSVRNPLEDILDKAGTAWRSILGDDAGAVQHEVDRLNEGQDITYRTHAGTPEVAGWGTHTDKETYIRGGNEYEERAQETREGRMVLESQSRYNGSLVSDSDGIAVDYDHVDQDGQLRGGPGNVA
jgi:uncharacterized protein YukE